MLDVNYGIQKASIIAERRCDTIDQCKKCIRIDRSGAVNDMHLFQRINQSEGN